MFFGKIFKLSTPFTPAMKVKSFNIPTFYSHWSVSLISVVVQMTGTSRRPEVISLLAGM